MTDTQLLRVQVADDQAGERLDRILAASVPELSRSRLQALIKAGAVTLDGRTIGDPGMRVKPGEMFLIDVPEPTAAQPKGEAMALSVVYEDDQIIVVDKPAGLVVHPAAGHASGTLVNALIAHCGDSLSGIGGVRRPGIVHRLDKDTSGLLVVAKTDAAHHDLSDQFRAHGTDGRLERRYRALVWGAPIRPRGTVDAPLHRSRANRTKIAVSESGDARHAVTHFEVKEIFRDAKGEALARIKFKWCPRRMHRPSRPNGRWPVKRGAAAPSRRATAPLVAVTEGFGREIEPHAAASPLVGQRSVEQGNDVIRQVAARISS